MAAWRKAFARMRRADAIVAAGVLVLAALAVLARVPLADWYFSHDAGYLQAVRGMPAVSARTGQLVPLLDTGAAAGRLRAAYVAQGCGGELERAQWIRRLGVTQAQDDAHLLACAACSRQRAVTDWLLDTAGDMDMRLRVLGEGRVPRTALTCAARDNDMALAERLLERGAEPRQMQPRYSAIAAAADGQRWAMLRLLLQKDPAAAPAATFVVLDILYAQNPYWPEQLLPQWVEAGLPLDAHDEAGHNLFHWAALRLDLRLTQALLARLPQSPLRWEADREGLRPWQLVLRGAQLRHQQVEGDSLELLRLLLPADVPLASALKAG
jgi:hypothetical protein